MTTKLVPQFDEPVLRGIAEVLGATEGGPTGAEIGYTLDQVRVPDVSPTITKRRGPGCGR